MAKKQQASNNPSQQSSDSTTNSFNKGMVKDYDVSFAPEGTWNHARNAANNSKSGDIGLLGNEPANEFCTQAPYTIIGSIPVVQDYFIIYSTDDTDCEIGLFHQPSCTYTAIVNDRCLSFNRQNLIIGDSKAKFDCSYDLYWDDGLNPSRVMNIGSLEGPSPNIFNNEPWPGVPYVCQLTNTSPNDPNGTTPGGGAYCVVCEPLLPLQLDCDKIRLSQLMSIPCVSISRGLGGGQLLNGSYYAVIAYSLNEQRMTDYFNPSEIQSLFVHGNARSSLDITFSNLDTDNFEQFQLVIVSTTNQQTVATEIGYYSTRTTSLSVDFIAPTLNVVPLGTVPLRTPGYEKSEAMYDVNGYLIRVAPTDRLDFNYQPFANQIGTEWIMTEQPFDYYKKGGNIIGYMRDEVYAFWIRWVYNDGKKSSSYHIPGRPPFAWEEAIAGTASDDNIEWQEDNTYQTKIWEVYNTAYPTSNALSLPVSNYPVSLTQGTIIARGKMGYWESTEKYPDNKPEVWNPTSNPSLFTINANNYTYDLCGRNIRHHKMPSDVFHSDGSGIGDFYNNDNFSHIRSIDGVDSPILGVTPTTPVAIRILGAQFSNIKAPVDNDGKIIPGIVGYEILRSSRQGNKSVIAKGIVNNMRSYKERGPSNNYQADDTEILYPNYVSNYQSVDFTLVSGDETSSNITSLGPPTYLKRDYYTFHSPDTNFEYPYLSAVELKFYGEKGSNYNMEGRFEPVPGHPKEKLLTNMALLIGAVVGLGIAFRAMRGRDIRTSVSPGAQNSGINGTGATTVVSSSINGALAATAAATYSQALSSVFNNAGIAVSGQDAALATLALAWGGINVTLSGVVGGTGSRYDNSTELSDYRYTPNGFKAAGGFLAFGYYWAQGTEQAIELIRAIVPFREYVMRSRSEIKLFKFQKGGILLGNTRRRIVQSTYLDNQFQILGDKRVNNLYRSRCVAIHTSRTMLNVAAVVDRSVQTIGSVQLAQTGVVNKGITNDNPSAGKFYATGAAYHGALKVRFRNQYGQIASTNQITTGCSHLIRSGLFGETPLPQSLAGQVVVQSTPDIFGGDTYISRYTEKNTFFYFYDWLYNVPDGVEINYTLKYMVTYPRFWANFQSFSADDFIQQVGAAFSQITITNPGNVNASQTQTKIGAYAFYNLDGGNIGTGFYTTGYSQGHGRFRLGVRSAYMYLFQSGIRDFFVESEYNADYRDYGDRPEEQIYDPYGYTDTEALFDTNIIKNGNYYKYDISLGVSRTMNNYISFGTAQGMSYDPFTAESCYKYFPFRVIYSLQSSAEDKKDYWRIFLINNYYDFDSRVTAFKSINRNGAIILLEKNSPLMFNAVDTLQTTSGTKITIGDGGLFSQPLQTLSNADVEFQHGSCQDRLSIINTPAGVFWMSSSQGKIFTVSEGMQPISDLGMKWWFSKYLTYFLLEQFPTYHLVGNPVVGIGCQATFDNENQILYFSKTDYKVKDHLLNSVIYSPKDQLFYFDNARIELGDPIYFDNLSWTISFDPKIKAWLSFHDWHPELGISNIKGFLTTKTDNGIGKIWKHYNNTSKFCNYYGADYPFEIDYISATGQAVTTTRSIEYLLECYVYDQDGIDRYEVLDYNFDKAIVYNNEQVSGNLRLNLSPKNNAPVIVNYPQIDTLTGIINILYSKEEQKYRFNQFWDFTRDRGEFQTGGILVQQPVWNTELNGYIRTLNTNNINLNKSPFERKKFRHYANHIVLIRTVSDNVKMLLKVVNNKLLSSPR
jgi:hypothetical protein